MLRRPLSEIELKQDDVDELKTLILRKECKTENLEAIEDRREKSKQNIKAESMPEEDMNPPREGSFTTP